MKKNFLRLVNTNLYNGNYWEWYLVDNTIWLTSQYGENIEFLNYTYIEILKKSWLDLMLKLV